jgi:hypothetical protein
MSGGLADSTLDEEAEPVRVQLWDVHPCGRFHVEKILL